MLPPAADRYMRNSYVQEVTTNCFLLDTSQRAIAYEPESLHSPEHIIVAY